MMKLKMHNKKIIFIFVCAALVIAFVSVELISGAFCKLKAKEQDDFVLPNETSVIVHLSTLSNDHRLKANPDSYLYYYDKGGELLGSNHIEEEVLGDFIAETKNGLSYLFKNGTVITNTTDELILPNNSDIEIKAIKFGPSETGYIDELDLSYSLLNVGQKKGYDSYVNVVRFVSADKNYDVIVPYYLEDITYDRITKQFICSIHSTNHLNSELYEEGNYQYVLIKYNEETKEFEFDETYHKISDSVNSDRSLYKCFLASNNMLYCISVNDTEEYINNNDIMKVRTHSDIVLTKYDLAKDEKLSDTYLYKNYEYPDDGKYFRTGSSHLPMETVGNTMYAFFSNNDVVRVNENGEVSKLSMPYSFKGSLSKYRIYSDKFDDKEDFFGTEVAVEDDGNIYILNLYPKNVLKIHKLLENGEYELVWQGKLPTPPRKGLFINTFEIVNYNSEY